jgi:hypothetical protein
MWSGCDSFSRFSQRRPDRNDIAGIPLLGFDLQKRRNLLAILVETAKDQCCSNPYTRQKEQQVRPESEWERIEVPEWRIMPEELWNAVVSGDLKVRGTHEPLISDQLFDAVQAPLNPKKTLQRKLNDNCPLRGVVRCATRGKLLTAGWAGGRSERYPRYWCWTKGCGAVGIGRDDLERQFVALLSRMEPTAELLDRLPREIAVQWKDRKERIAAEARRLTNRLADQDTLNQKAIIAKVDQEISTEDFETLKKTIVEQKIAIQNAISALDSERSTMEEMLKQANAQAVDLVTAWKHKPTSRAGPSVLPGRIIGRTSGRKSGTIPFGRPGCTSK